MVAVAVQAATSLSLTTIFHFRATRVGGRSYGASLRLKREVKLAIC